MSRITAPKGIVDILPAESWKWQAIEQIARVVAELYHFSEIRTPIFEHSELFHRGVGETSDIVHKLLDSFNPPIDCFLIIQHEAALKFAGAPNRQTLFSALHGPWLRTEIVHTFQAHDFVPAPKVTAVLLRIEQRDESLVPTSESEIYRDFVSYIFNHANPNILPSLKQLFSGKNFDASEQALGNKLTAKPSQLEIHDWITLFRAFMATASNSQHQLIVGASVKQQREAASLEKHHRTRLDKNWRSTSKPKGR